MDKNLLKHSFTPVRDNMRTITFMLLLLASLQIAWSQTHTVNVSSAGNGTVVPGGDTALDNGSDLDISADPDSRYHFINWSVTGGLNVDNVNSANTQITNIENDGSVTANFGKNVEITTDAAVTPSTQWTGKSVDFTIDATGAGPIVYKWYKNSIPHPISTDEDFTLVINSVNDAGDYYCKVSNGGGVVTSNDTTLTVNKSVAITNQPDNDTGWTGESVTLSITASASGTLVYQWQKKIIGIVWVDVGDDDSEYEIDSVKLSHAGTYRCVVTDEGDSSVTSAEADLTVFQTVYITDHPDSVTKNYGESVTFSVTALGQEPINYRWRKDGSWISGATDSTYTINSVNYNDAGLYRCRVRNGGGSEASNDATLTVKGGGITLVSPNGGEKWCMGSTQDITWTTIGIFNSVKIEFSTTGGSGWQVITGSAPNTGIYAWTIPITLTEFCLVHISNALDDFPADESDGVFTIGDITANQEQEEIDVSLGINFLVIPNPVCNDRNQRITFLFTPVKDIISAVVKVFDPLGNVAYEFNSGNSAQFNAGTQCTLGSWDLKNNSGRFIAGGVYIATVVFTGADGEMDMQKTIIGVKDN